VRRVEQREEEKVAAKPINRREFVRRGSLYGAGILIGLNTPRPKAAQAAAESVEPAILTEHEWETLDALTGRIIPADEDPGAREANCVNFIDKALAHEDAAALPLYQGGLAALDGVAMARFETRFVGLESAQQDEILAALERGTAKEWALSKELPSPMFFETVRVHTIVGFLADPSYGGNRDFSGWKVAGYPGPRHRRGGYTPEQVEGQAPIVPVWDLER
jgi:hypothetical protein